MIIPCEFDGYGEGGRLTSTRRVYDSGGSSTPSKTTQVSDLPEWAKPYAKETLGKTQALTDINQNPYQTYQGERVAGFTPLQQQAFQGAEQLGPSQLGAQAGQIAGAAALSGLGASYNPYQAQNQYQAPDAYTTGQFSNAFQAPGAYQAGQFAADRVASPAESLQTFQMSPAERVRADMFGGRQAAQYMSPFIQEAMEPQLRELGRASEIQRNVDQARAVGAGAFGGSRQAIVEAERQRNLAQQQGDIRARGYQAAYEQAAGQFNQDAARRMQAALANQQAGINVGQQNLAAALGVQQLGAQTGLQSALANQQAGLQAQQMAEQSRQFGAGQGLSAAQLQAQYGLSAQQAEEASRQFAANQAAQQASTRAQFGQAAEQLGEQSRQYGAGLGLQGLQTALQGAGQMGALGGQQFGQQRETLGVQQQFGAQQQALEQQRLGQQYQDFINQQRYPYQQLEFMSNIMRGTPMGTVQTLYQPAPSTASQLIGAGTAALGASRFFAEGGEVSDRPAGLADLALMKLGA